MLCEVSTSATVAHEISFFVLLDNCAQPAIRGNKRFKLADNLRIAQAQGYRQVVSFGGAYSNHIYALAWAAKEKGMHSVGIIRGEPAAANNPTLSDAQQCGMRLEFVSREDYRQRHDTQWLQAWQQHFPNATFLPEGGSNLTAVLACQRMLDGLAPEFLARISTLACAVGTGATACGLSIGLGNGQQGNGLGDAGKRVRGYSVVADPSRHCRMQTWLDQITQPRAQIDVVEAHVPAYGRLNRELAAFINDFHRQTGVLPDPLYTGKMLQQLTQDINAGVFARGSTVVAVHTGGLQGWRGFMRAQERTHSLFSGDTLDAVRRQSEIISGLE